MPAPVLSVGSTVNATVSVGVLEAATDYKGQRSLPRDFSIELKQGSLPTSVDRAAAGIRTGGTRSMAAAHQALPLI